MLKPSAWDLPVVLIGRAAGVLCTPCMVCRVRRVWCVAYAGMLPQAYGQRTDGRLYDEFQRDVPSIFVATTFW